MSPADARRLQLVAELRRDWQHVRASLEAAESVDPAGSRAEAALGLRERSGSGWHGRLLSDGELDLPGVRPRVYPDGAARGWAALLRFRHFLRHAYGVPLDPAELSANGAHLSQAVAASEPTLERLLQALAD